MRYPMVVRLLQGIDKPSYQYKTPRLLLLCARLEVAVNSYPFPAPSAWLFCQATLLKSRDTT